ncbi:MAG: hypothetical protein KGL95_01810, partial [Patescibacteria group bacterium]|nr:hypothetical protein [Patescibacteria group bacterium]
AKFSAHGSSLGKSHLSLYMILAVKSIPRRGMTDYTILKNKAVFFNYLERVIRDRRVAKTKIMAEV